MAQFIAFDQNVEVNGQTVLALIIGVSETYKERIFNILAKHNILDPSVGKWYKQQDWLNCFRDISDKIGKFTLFSIGKTIPESAVFPEHIDTLEKALNSIDIAYHANHRNGEIGYYKVLSFNTIEHTAIMECYTPYPCHFDRGIIMAMVRRFKPADSVLQDVVVDETKPQRLLGDEMSTYIIIW